MKRNKRVVLLMSGKGSDLVSLYYSSVIFSWFKVDIVGVIVDRECLAKEVAEEIGIPVLMIKGEKQQKNKQILKQVKKWCPDCMIMSGFLSILDNNVINYFGSKRIINIHPSLLPQFRGRDPQKQALEAKVKVTGVTLHYVDESIDTGEIIIRVEAPICKGDTLDTLSQRLQLLGSLMLLNEVARMEEE